MHSDPRRSIRVWIVMAVVLCVATAAPVQAQIEENLSSYGADNATGYLEPLKDAFAAGLSNGLFPAGAVPTEGLHARISVQAMIVNFGDDDRFFRPIVPEGVPVPSGTEIPDAPTVAGPTEGTAIDLGGGATYSFPGGLDLDRLPLAVPQITVGGPMGTEATLRFLGFESGDDDIGDISFIGFGGRHSISQYLPNLPIELAGMVYYQKLEVGEDLLDARVFSIGVQGSKRFTVLEPYAGLGLDRSSLDVVYDDQTDTRIEVSFDEETNAHLTLGTVLHLALLKVNGEFNVSDRTSFTLGASVGF